jgi:hypothetical protein
MARVTSGTGARRCRPSRSSRLRLMVAAALICIFAGCSSGSGSDPSSTAEGSAASANTDLHVLSAPDGYELDTGSGSTNGPINAPQFDEEVGIGASVKFRFREGYDITYDSTSTDESIESTLYSFASPVGATSFEPTALSLVGANALNPKRNILGSIPGSTVVEGSRPGSDGFYLVDVVARSGSAVMVVEYADDSAPPLGVPEVLWLAATDQYALLQH